jgi:TRAP-type mannitol/chloroaromatic compound transport system permease small subunit
VNHMVTALGAFGLLYASILIAQFTYRSGRMTRMEFDIPTWTLYIGLILGAAILIFYALALMIKEFGRMISERTGPTEDNKQ